MHIEDEPTSYDKWKKEQQEEPKEVENRSFLVGQAVPWSEIIQEDNNKEWLWENYIAKGNITLLSALWKAGKSTLLRCLFLAMSEQEEFAGQPTTKCKVMVLSEEDKGEWSDKREDLEDAQIQNILVWARPLRAKPNLAQWIEMIKEVTEKCVAEGIDLLVIDTLTTFWPIDNENDSAQVIKALVPLYSLTENNIAVLLVHHFRKGGGDQAQASRGSGALPGFVDNIIEFTRNDNGSFNQRILKTYGRFDGVIPRVEIVLNSEGKYDTLGDPWVVSKLARLDTIIDIFESLPSNQTLSVKEVFTLLSKKAADSSERTVRRYIQELASKNILTIIEEKVVRSKKTPFYALKGGYIEQRTMLYTLPVVPPLSAVESLGSLSAVSPQYPQNRASTADKGGTSPIRELTDFDPNI